MTKITAAALKRALKRVGAEQLKRPAASAPDAARHAMLRENRRASERMITEALRSTGFDLKKYKSLQEARGSELQRAVAEHKAQAIRHATKKAALRSGAFKQADGLRKLALDNGFFPHPSFNLDTPLLIWGIPNTPIYDDAIVPFGSWAKFKFSASSSQGEQVQRVGFYYIWTNPYNDIAMINAATSFSANGYIQANAGWSLWAHYSQVWALALFNIWLGWPTSEASSSSDFSELASASAFSTWLGGDTNGTTISAGLSLTPATPFAVPPGGVVFFEVAMDIHYDIDGGDIEADFQSGDFQIDCPVVVVWLLNTPGFKYPYPVNVPPAQMARGRRSGGGPPGRPRPARAG